MTRFKTVGGGAILSLYQGFLTLAKIINAVIVVMW